MSKRKGYRFARLAPFPTGNLGVSAVRNKTFDREAPLHRAMVSVFMPPMNDVTINVTSQNAGRFHLSTDGLIPVISNKIDKGIHYLFLVDKDKQVSPFSIANVFDNGEVCWGPNGQPFSLRAAWEEFFTRPFNTDLTPIKNDDDHEDRRQQIIYDYREQWISSNTEKMEPWISRFRTIPFIQSMMDNGLAGPAYGGDVDRPLYSMFRGSTFGPDSRSLLTGVPPHKYTPDMVGRFPYTFDNGTVRMVRQGASHEVKDSDISQTIWSPSFIRDRITRILEMKSRLEGRRRARATDLGKSWSGFAAHDPTWIAMLRYEQRWLERWRMVGMNSPDSLAKSLGVGRGWRFELAKKTVDDYGIARRDEVEYSITDHAASWCEWRIRVKAADPSVGWNGFDDDEQKKLYNPRLAFRENRSRVLRAANDLLNTLNKRGPRQLRGFYLRWIRLWMKALYVQQLDYRIRGILDNRMTRRFGDPSMHPIDFSSIGGDDGLGHGLKANVKRHFLGGWKKTLSFREMGDLIAPVEQQTFFAPHRFDGMACIPLNVYANVCADRSKLPYKAGQLQAVVGMPARFFDDDSKLSTGRAVSYAFIPALYKRFMEYSVALVQMFWNHDDSVYLYDGRWRMVKIPDGATVEEVERMARELDSTEQWGIGRPTASFSSNADEYGYTKSVLVPDSDAVKAAVERAFNPVPVS